MSASKVIRSAKITIGGKIAPRLQVVPETKTTKEVKVANETGKIAILTKVGLATVIKAAQGYYEMETLEMENFLRSKATITLKDMKGFLGKYKLRSTAEIKKEKREASRVNDIKPYLGNFKASSVLDIGAGDASITEEIRAFLKIPKEKTYAIDIHPITNPNVTALKYGDKQSIPLGDKSIDLITLFVALHHIPDNQQDRLFKEISRILKDDGRVIIREHACPEESDEGNNFSYMEDLIHYVHIIANNEDEDYYASYMTIQKVNDIMTSQGFHPYLSSAYIKERIHGAQRIYYNAFVKESLVSKYVQIVYRRSDMNHPGLFDSKAWLQRMLNTLASLLDASYIARKFIPVWVRAFTDASWSTSESGEDIRYLGKAILSCLTTIYMLNVYPNLTESEYTDFRKRLNSKELMTKYGNELGLFSLVRRRDFGIDDGWMANVFLSFIGGVYLTSSSEKAGIEKCQSIIFTLFNRERIDSTWYEIRPTTQITQLFTTLGERSNIFEIERGYNQFTISLNPYGKRRLEDLIGHKIHINRITANGVNTHEAQEKAYSEMYHSLKTYKIDIKWAQLMRSKKLLSDANLMTYFDNADIYQGDKLTVIYDGVEYTVQQLIGTRGDKKTIIMSVIYGKGNRHQAQEMLLRDAQSIAKAMITK